MMNLPHVLSHKTAKRSRLFSAAVVYLLLLSLTAPAFAQASREDVQLQIVMVKTPGTKHDSKGQLLTLQVNDRSGAPVIAAEVVVTARNGELTDNEGRSQGTTITYYTNEQGRVELRARRNKAGAFVGINATASSLGRVGVKTFNLQFPSPPFGLGAKIATIAAIGAAGAAAAVLASKQPSKPGAPPATEIVVGTPSIP